MPGLAGEQGGPAEGQTVTSRPCARGCRRSEPESPRENLHSLHGPVAAAEAVAGRSMWAAAATGEAEAGNAPRPCPPPRGSAPLRDFLSRKGKAAQLGPVRLGKERAKARAAPRGLGARRAVACHALGPGWTYVHHHRVLGVAGSGLGRLCMPVAWRRFCHVPRRASFRPVLAGGVGEDGAYAQLHLEVQEVVPGVLEKQVLGKQRAEDGPQTRLLLRAEPEARGPWGAGSGQPGRCRRHLLAVTAGTAACRWPRRSLPSSRGFVLASE